MVTQGSRIDQRKFSSGVSAHKRVWMTLLSLCLIAGSNLTGLEISQDWEGLAILPRLPCHHRMDV